MRQSHVIVNALGGRRADLAVIGHAGACVVMSLSRALAAGWRARDLPVITLNGSSLRNQAACA
jgi:hypothetical protein